MYKATGLQHAEIVYQLLQSMLDETFQVAVYGYTANGDVSGYHFQHLENGKCCNVTANHVTDGLVFNFGGYIDYDYQSKHARDTATREDYGYNQHYQVAQRVLTWLSSPLPQYNTLYPEQATLDPVLDREIEMAKRHPFDQSNEDYQPSPEILAARTILRDLSDRRGLKQPLTEIPFALRWNIVQALAQDINSQDIPKSVQDVLNRLQELVPYFRNEWDQLEGDTDVVEEIIDTHQRIIERVYATTAPTQSPRARYAPTTVAAVMVNRPHLALATVTELLQAQYGYTYNSRQIKLPPALVKRVITDYLSSNPTVDENQLSMAINHGFEATERFLAERNPYNVHFGENLT